MRTKFFKNLFFVILLNVLIKPLWVFGIDRGVQNHLGYAPYGLYFALSSFSMMFNFIIDFGIASFNSRVISQEPAKAKQFLPQIFYLKLFLTILYLIISLAIAFFWQIKGYALWLLLVLCFNQIMLSFILYFRSNISSFHFFKIDSLLSITDKVLMILFFSFFLFIPKLQSHFTIDWFIYGQFICYGITFLIALAVNIFYIGGISFKINMQQIIAIWKNSYGYALVIFFMTIYTRIDAVMLERLVSAREAGIYASAYRLLDTANQFGFLFSVLLLPIFSRMIGKKNPIGDLLSSSYTAIILFATGLCLVCFFYNYEIMHLLYHEATPFTAKILRTLIFSLIGTSTVYVFGTLLAANANLQALNLITASAMVFNLVVNYFLIQRYGASGAALTAAATNILVGGCEILIVKSIFKLDINYTLLAKMSLYLIGGIAGTYLVKNYLPLPWLIQIMLTAMLLVIFAFVLRLLDWRRIYALRVATIDE